MSWTEYIARMFGLENYPKAARVVSIALPIILVVGLGLLIYTY